MTAYGNLALAPVPQSQPAHPTQVKNNAGGYVFEAGPWKQLDRFLVLGQIGPTYYASESKVVKENATVIQKCLKEDGLRVVRRIVEISDSGRAPKNDPAVFALALAASCDVSHVRAAALAALPSVCRIGTHLFHFAADVNAARGWGRGLRNAIARWYTARSADSLAMQAIKYQQRDGWSHRDLLRLSHAKPASEVQNATLSWMAGKPGKIGQHPLLNAFDELKSATQKATVLRLVREHKLPREAIPTQWLNDPDVWTELLPHMGITAMVRNLAKMTAIGLLKPMGAHTKFVSEVLTDEEAIAKGRVHPMAFLLAGGVYGQGHGEKGKLTWQPVREVKEALDAGFYAAFKSVTPTGKNTLIALDVSGSMDGGVIAGAPGITPRIASAAMAMVTARAEKNWQMIAFTSSGGWGGRAEICRLDTIQKNDSLESICKKVRHLPFGGTDCSLPMLYALQEKVEIDCFQIYTDNETWAGNVHPHKALQDYRKKMGRPDAKLCVVGLTATNFTIADPNDGGMLDVVGMDSHAPAVMADFAREGF